MAAKTVRTVFEVLWLLYRRMVEGKDRRRKATKAQQKSFLIDVEQGERQGAGSFDVQFVRDADGTWWEDHLDWSHALRWPLFNINAVDPLRIRILMDHLSQTIDRESWATAPLEILIRKSLSGDEYHVFTFEYILELQREGAFDGLRCHILSKCPHLANLFHEQTEPASSWKPRDGFVAAKAVFANDGKPVPRQTVQGWIETDHPDVDRDPTTGAVWVDGEWLRGRLAKYHRRGT